MSFRLAREKNPVNQKEEKEVYSSKKKKNFFHEQCHDEYSSVFTENVLDGNRIKDSPNRLFIRNLNKSLPRYDDKDRRR